MIKELDELGAARFGANSLHSPMASDRLSPFIYENDATAMALKSLAVSGINASWENARRLQITDACSGLAVHLRALIGTRDRDRRGGSLAALIQTAAKRGIVDDRARRAMHYLREKRNAICHARSEEDPLGFTDAEILAQVQIVREALQTAGLLGRDARVAAAGGSDSDEVAIVENPTRKRRSSVEREGRARRRQDGEGGEVAETSASSNVPSYVDIIEITSGEE